VKHEPNRLCAEPAASRVTALSDREVNNISRPLKEEGKEK